MCQQFMCVDGSLAWNKATQFDINIIVNFALQTHFHICYVELCQLIFFLAKMVQQAHN